MTSEDASMHKTVMLFEFMLGPSFVLNNLYRCFTIFSFLAIAMILKTIFTIGVTDTMHYFTVCYFWKINLKSQIQTYAYPFQNPLFKATDYGHPERK